MPNPAENELANIWAKKKNLNVAEDEKTEKKDGLSPAKDVTGLGGNGNGSLRVLPPCVRASQEEDALLRAAKLTDRQETFEPAAVRRQRPKSIKIGATELVLEGSGGKGQALFKKMAQTNPE